MHPRRCSPFIALTAMLGLLVTLPIAAEEGFGSVAGNVKIGGVLLAEGKVLLHSDGAKPIEIPIKGGEFTAARVVAGQKKISIEGVGVPEKYKLPQLSGLSIEVKTGRNQIEFDLRE